MTISKRLKAERERLGLSQPQLGALVGVGKTTVINWEKGSSAPDAVQLSVLAATNADVFYILTGTRAATATALAKVRAASEAASRLGGSEAEQAHAAEALFDQLNAPPLTRRQRALLDNYEAADEAGKKVIEGTAGLAAQPKAARAGRK